MTVMTQQPEPLIHIRAFKLSGWRAIAAAVTGLVLLGVVVTFLALGFLFVAVPALAAASIAYYFRPKPMIGSVQSKGNIWKAGSTGNGTIIDGTFKVAPDNADDRTNGRK